MYKKAFNKVLGYKSIRSSQLLSSFLFGFKPKPKNRRTLWDNTTILFRSALRKWVKENDSVLELGTGDIAILSIFLSMNKKIYAYASDIFPEFINNAKLNAKFQKVKINFICSNLFNNIEKNDFDVIFFNPPYVKTSDINIKYIQEYHNFSKSEMAIATSDGGNDGLDIVRNFLKKSNCFLNENGSILLGLNKIKIDYHILEKIITKNGFFISDTLSSSYNDCEILKLRLL